MASLLDVDEVGRVAFYNVGLQAAQLVGQHRRKWFDKLKADVIKVFSELRCDVLCLSEMGEVQVGLESAFARAEIISSGVAQPAPGSLRRWFEGALQEVQAGDWGINPRGHYVTLWSALLCSALLCTAPSCCAIRVVSDRVTERVSE